MHHFEMDSAKQPLEKDIVFGLRNRFFFTVESFWFIYIIVNCSTLSQWPSFTWSFG